MESMFNVRIYRRLKAGSRLVPLVGQGLPLVGLRIGFAGQQKIYKVIEALIGSEESVVLLDAPLEYDLHDKETVTVYKDEQPNTMETGLLTEFGYEAGAMALAVKGDADMPPIDSFVRFAGHDNVYRVSGSKIGMMRHIHISPSLEHSVPANSAIYSLQPEMPPEDVQPGREATPGKPAAMHTDTPSPQEVYPVMSTDDISASQVNKRVDQLFGITQHFMGHFSALDARATGLDEGLKNIEKYITEFRNGLRAEVSELRSARAQAAGVDVDALTKRLNALESRVDRVQESAVGGIDANHLNKRIDDLERKANKRVDQLFDITCNFGNRIGNIEHGLSKIEEHITTK